MTRILSALLVPLLGVAAPAAAQVETPAPVPHQQTVSANPFGLIFGWFNAEYERKLTSTTTWGVSGSMLDVDSFNYRSASGLLRYYPQGNQRWDRVLREFAGDQRLLHRTAPGLQLVLALQRCAE